MLRQNTIAVDISDQSVKVLQLTRDFGIAAFGSATLEMGVVEKGVIINGKAFSATLDEVLKNTKPKALRPSDGPLLCTVNLPETQMFIHYCVVPDTVKDAEIEAYIRGDAEKVVPFEFDQLYSTHHVATVNGIRHATFVSAPREIVDNYMNVLTEADLRPVALGGAFFSLGRSVLADSLGENNYIVVDMGANTTSIGVFDVDAVATFTALVPTGGTYLTEQIAEKCSIEHEEAEEKKKEQGLMGSEAKGNVSEVLKGSLITLVSEINAVKKFYEEKFAQSITEIILVGGSALMPGMCPYIEAEVGLKTHLGDPLLKIKDHSALPKDTSPIFFAGVIGLALRARDETLPGIDLLKQYRRDRDGEHKEKIPLREIRSFGEALYVVRDMLALGGKKYAALTHRFRLDTRVNVKLVLSLLFALIMLGVLVYIIITYI